MKVGEKMIDLLPIHNPNHDCFDDVIATIANWYGHNYQLLLADAWDFAFKNDKKNIIGENIGIGGNIRTDYLEHYHGIKFIQTETAQEGKLKYEMANNAKPICVNIDTFWCPWDKNYKIFHNLGHSIIIVGIYDEGFYCVDPFYEKKNVYLPYKNYVLGCRNSFRFSLLHKNDDNIPYKNIINNTLMRLTKTQVFNQIVEFANKILELDYLLEFKDYENVWHSPLIFRLGRLILDRKRYIVVLDYFLRKYKFSCLENIIERFKDVENQWSIIRLSIVKNTLNKTYTRNPELSRRIIDIAQKEKEIAEILFDECN